MFAIEFRLRLSSMYSIRVPYSYQCARTYPLPAPSTIKGLCANALWRTSGRHPVDLLKEIHSFSHGATSRADNPIAISTCTVRIVPQDALLRQFAFTHSIDCLILFKDNAKLCSEVANALSISPIYLGDSESLAVVIPDSIVARPIKSEHITAGNPIPFVNTITAAKLMTPGTLQVHPTSKGTVLYMQEDPIAAEAELDRYLAPLMQAGDIYHPLEGFSFIAGEDCVLIKGQRLSGVFPIQDKSSSKSSVVKKRSGRSKTA